MVSGVHKMVSMSHEIVLRFSSPIKKHPIFSFRILKPGVIVQPTNNHLPAEKEGFEPPEPFSSTVFKTAAIDHSAISPFLKNGAKVRKRIDN